MKGGENYEKNREISLYYHNSPYYCDFNHFNKNSTNCLKSVLEHLFFGIVPNSSKLGIPFLFYASFLDIFIIALKMVY